MDTTETNIKMCEKAEEIQDYFDEWDDDVVLVCSVCRTRYGNCRAHPELDELEHRMIKVPRQDQLQEMAFTAVSGTYNKLPTKVFAFADYWEENGIPTMFFSLEQLWLAFVMKEKYGKVWNGEDWVKEG